MSIICVSQNKCQDLIIITQHANLTSENSFKHGQVNAEAAYEV